MAPGVLKAAGNIGTRSAVGDEVFPRVLGWVVEGSFAEKADDGGDVEAADQPGSAAVAPIEEWEEALHHRPDVLCVSPVSRFP